MLTEKRHPYIVSLLHSFQDEVHLYLVMDFVGGGDLFALIEANEKLPEDWARVYAAEIALALEHVHAQSIIFRDLKPENVMIGVDGHVKLADFGLAKKVEESAPINMRGSIVGTPEYMAPELLSGKAYGKAVDWWTLGCLTYEMIAGRGPFTNPNMAELVRQITQEDPVMPSFVSEACVAAIRALMSRDPKVRLGGVGCEGGYIREHAWYAELDWEALMRREIAAPQSMLCMESPDPKHHTLREDERARLRVRPAALCTVTLHFPADPCANLPLDRTDLEWHGRTARLVARKHSTMAANTTQPTPW
jgi:serine/threonine protein kinase